MRTNDPTKLLPSPEPAKQRSAMHADVSRRTVDISTPSEIFALLGVVVVAGPPVILLVGSATLFVMFLCAPVVLTAATVIVPWFAVTVILALGVAILAVPYRLVRWVRSHRASSSSLGRPLAEGTSGPSLIAGV